MQLGISLGVNQISRGPSGPIVTTTFDPTFATAFLSNANMSVSGLGTYPLARSSTTKTTGKYYVETTAATGSTYHVIGVITPAVLSSPFGYLTNLGSVLVQVNGLGYRDGTSFSGAPNNVLDLPGATIVAGLAIDLDNRKIWYRNPTSDWNGVAGNNPATNTGGFSFGSGIGVGAAVHVAIGPTDTQTQTVNFGGSAYQITPPSGFLPWT
jgi:hypothetical protein